MEEVGGLDETDEMMLEQDHGIGLNQDHRIGFESGTSTILLLDKSSTVKNEQLKNAMFDKSTINNVVRCQT